MKKTVLKYTTLIFTMLSAIFVFLPWFNIKIFDEELHSFITIPNLLANASGILMGYAGKTSAVSIIILGGVLEYLCIISGGLALCGIWKNCFREKKTKMIFTSQIITISLIIIASIAMLGSNYLIQTALNIEGIIAPTVCFIISIVFTVASFVSQLFYNKELK